MVIWQAGKYLTMQLGQQQLGCVLGGYATINQAEQARLAGFYRGNHAHIQPIYTLEETFPKTAIFCMNDLSAIGHKKLGWLV